MHGAHPGKPGIQSDQHVQALGLPDLADHQPVRPHAQGLLDQPAQRDLPLPLQVRLAALKPHDVAERKLQLEDFLHGDDPLAGADAGGEAVQHGGLARLGGARDQDVEAAGHGRAEKPGRLRGERAQLHQMLQPAGLDHELADIDGPVTPGDVRDDHVEPGAVRERGIHERGRHVQAPAGALEHPLHQVPDLLVREARRRSAPIRRCGPRRFHSARSARFPRCAGSSRSGWSAPKPATASKTNLRADSSGPEGRQRRQEGPLVVVADRRLHQAPDFAGLPQGIQAPAADQLTDFVLDNAHSLHCGPQYDGRPVGRRCNWVKARGRRSARQGACGLLVDNRNVAACNFHLSNSRITGLNIPGDVRVGAISQTFPHPTALSWPSPGTRPP